MSVIPSKMRAAVWGWTGGASFDQSSKVPTCGRGEVLIRVKAAAINPVDYKLGRMLGSVVGLDVAGVVESVGSNVTSLKIGDEVFGGVSGSLAEFAVGKPESLGKKAKCLSFVEAAAMPIAYMTSLQSLRDAGNLQPGSRVLIIGASGGCGLAAVQLAKAMDAGHIAGVCSGKNEAIVKANGATEVVDYTKGDVVEHFTRQEESETKKFDIVYDSATNSGGGEDYREKSLKLLKQDESNHGQYVAINGAASMWARNFTIGQKKNEHLVVTNMNTTDLEVLSTMAEEGKLKPVICQHLPLDAESLEKGFDLLKSRRAVGKIVFDLTK